MILACTGCDSRYDVSGYAVGQAFRCRCGAVTELRALDALAGFPTPGFDLEEVASSTNLEIHFVDSSGVIQRRVNVDFSAGTMTVNGPGHRDSVSRRATSGHRDAKAWASDGCATWTISGLCAGRPLAA